MRCWTVVASSRERTRCTLFKASEMDPGARIVQKLSQLFEQRLQRHRRQYCMLRRCQQVLSSRVPRGSISQRRWSSSSILLAAYRVWRFRSRTSLHIGSKLAHEHSAEVDGIFEVLFRSGWICCLLCSLYLPMPRTSKRKATADSNRP